MSRVLVIPDAGTDTRLPAPRALAAVDGRPMVDYLFDLYRDWVDGFVLVVHPSFADQVEAHCADKDLAIDFALQTSPTGTLDAILLASEPVRRHRPRQVWITWCDRIAVRPTTIRRLAELCGKSSAPLVMPTLHRRDPSIHFVRETDGRIVDVLDRQEGDAMPEVGEGDLGLFVLSDHAYLEVLPRMPHEVAAGASTGERRFLPFIPWLNTRAPVETFPGQHESEMLGVNSPEDLVQVNR